MKERLTAYDAEMLVVTRIGRDILLMQGEYKFGPASDEVKSKIKAVTDPDHLARLLLGIVRCYSWDNLFFAAQ